MCSTCSTYMYTCTISHMGSTCTSMYMSCMLYTCTVEEHAQVSPEDLKRLKTSASILEAVKSAQLQEVVRTILEARDPHKALQSRLEKDPYFSSFADDIMIAIGKAERTPDGHVVVL